MMNNWWLERGYRTKEALKVKIREIINGNAIENIIIDPVSKELLIWVLSHHHEYHAKYASLKVAHENCNRHKSRS